MEPPAIDHAIGMEIYSTTVSGIGGRIKRASDQFFVEEILDSTLDISSTPDDIHPYPLYLLRKNGIDSTHAVKEVWSTTGMKLKIIGLKDARAITKQFASMTSSRRRDAKERVVTNHCMLDLVGFTNRPISKRVLVGNRFTVTVSDLQASPQTSLEELQDHTGNYTTGNFYGYQRFGSTRPVTHLVGREIVKRNFSGAVDLLLGYTSEYESRQSREIREMCKDRSRFPDLLRMMPQQMDIERALIAEMIRSNDPIKAFRRLPVTVRRLFVQAYQSYIFNRSLSTAIREGCNIAAAEKGDLCFSYADNGVRVDGMNRFDGSTKMQLPAVPLAGYAFRESSSNSSSRFGTIVKKVMMEEEGVRSRDFYVKELQEISAEGGFRQASMLCREFSYSLNGSLQVRFVLPKGSYATVLLRELIKPADPVAAGF